MLQMAIYLRAGLTLIHNTLRRFLLPLVEGTLVFAGLLFLQHFSNYHFHDPNYYDDQVKWFNFSAVCTHLVRRHILPVPTMSPSRFAVCYVVYLLARLLLAATYGFLEDSYRSSRALLLLGTAWAFAATLGVRWLWFFIRHRSLDMGREKSRRLILVGSTTEAERALQLLHKAGVKSNPLGRVNLEASAPTGDALGNIRQLPEIVRIYKVDEIIFCSKDMAVQDIMQWMTQLGPQLLYKILPEDSISIIGSHSKNTSGELYTIDIQFNIAHPLQRRNKRLFDLGVSLLLMATTPLWLLLLPPGGHTQQRAWRVLFGQGKNPVACTPDAALHHLPT
ncbi:MAG: hypothetical protein R2795_12010 [Saprospiraceae bacterium]